MSRVISDLLQAAAQTPVTVSENVSRHLAFSSDKDVRRFYARRSDVSEPLARERISLEHDPEVLAQWAVRFPELVAKRLYPFEEADPSLSKLRAMTVSILATDQRHQVVKALKGVHGDRLGEFLAKNRSQLGSLLRDDADQAFVVKHTLVEDVSEFYNPWKASASMMDALFDRLVTEPVNEATVQLWRFASENSPAGMGDVDAFKTALARFDDTLVDPPLRECFLWWIDPGFEVNAPQVAALRELQEQRGFLKYDYGLRPSSTPEEVVEFLHTHKDRSPAGQLISWLRLQPSLTPEAAAGILKGYAIRKRAGRTSEVQALVFSKVNVVDLLAEYPDFLTMCVTPFIASATSLDSLVNFPVDLVSMIYRQPHQIVEAFLEAGGSLDAAVTLADGFTGTFGEFLTVIREFAPEA